MRRKNARPALGPVVGINLNAASRARRPRGWLFVLVQLHPDDRSTRLLRVHRTAAGAAGGAAEATRAKRAGAHDDPRRRLDALLVGQSDDEAQRAARVVAGGIGYVMYIRPKWYPTITYEKAKTFTPKEIAEWNEGQQQLKKR